jgi:hypothetical protein
MSWFSKLAALVPKVFNPPPKVNPIPRPNPAAQPAPPIPVRVAAPAPAPVLRQAISAPRLAAPSVAAASPRPVAPWFANEAPRLHATTQTIQSAIFEIDAALADSSALARTVWWKGHDADQFREQIRLQHNRLLETRGELARSMGAFDSAAAQEQQRFVTQERSW